MPASQSEKYLGTKEYFENNSCAQEEGQIQNSKTNPNSGTLEERQNLVSKVKNNIPPNQWNLVDYNTHLGLDSSQTDLPKPKIDLGETKSCHHHLTTHPEEIIGPKQNCLKPQQIAQEQGQDPYYDPGQLNSSQTSSWPPLVSPHSTVSIAMYTSMYYILTYFAGSFGRYNMHAKIFLWIMTVYPIVTALTGFQFANLLPYIMQVIPTIIGYCNVKLLTTASPEKRRPLERFQRLEGSSLTSRAEEEIFPHKSGEVDHKSSRNGAKENTTNLKQGVSWM
ncbi:hypothetical protein DSO57_1008310 [Entomophthora muscae]|uniref:Uncharacterized protein n=1 Tax=Entomophthora muscae TaxID=34485 RepID=A0ACC2UU79_9FUNG|nr:hypothetical protein DSO57_1008310 [Entomophthora muscae]